MYINKIVKLNGVWYNDFNLGRSVLIVAKKRKTKSLKTGIRILMAFVLFGIVTTALAITVYLIFQRYEI